MHRLGPHHHGYLAAVHEQIAGALGPDLVAVYLTGSAAFSDFEPATSDLDLTVITRGSLPVERRSAVVAGVTSVDCPVRGIELVSYPLHAVAEIAAVPGWEINLNVGPRMPVRVSFDPASEPRHWFVLDLAVARSEAIALHGPPAASVIAPVPRERIIAALDDSLAWHIATGEHGYNSVLNACRAWRFSEDGTLGSKTEAAEWAMRHGGGEIVESAIAARRGDAVRLAARPVVAFVDGVRERLAHA